MLNLVGKEKRKKPQEKKTMELGRSKREESTFPMYLPFFTVPDSEEISTFLVRHHLLGCNFGERYR